MDNMDDLGYDGSGIAFLGRIVLIVSVLLVLLGITIASIILW
jgi:hypothetical protein